MRCRPDSSPFLAEALRFAALEPGLYEVTAVFEPAGGDARPDAA